MGSLSGLQQYVVQSSEVPESRQVRWQAQPLSVTLPSSTVVIVLVLVEVVIVVKVVVVVVLVLVDVVIVVVALAT